MYSKNRAHIDAILARFRQSKNSTTTNKAYLAIAAGINEELLFRAALPTALYHANGDLLYAIIISGLVFSIGHIYQGMSGLIATFISAIALSLCIYYSGTLLLPIAIHIMIDTMSLVVMPILEKRYDKYYEKH